MQHPTRNSTSSAFAEHWFSILPVPISDANPAASYWWEISMHQVEVSRTITVLTAALTPRAAAKLTKTQLRATLIRAGAGEPMGDHLPEQVDLPVVGVDQLEQRVDPLPADQLQRSALDRVAGRTPLPSGHGSLSEWRG